MNIARSFFCPPHRLATPRDRRAVAHPPYAALSGQGDRIPLPERMLSMGAVLDVPPSSGDEYGVGRDDLRAETPVRRGVG